MEKAQLEKIVVIDNFDQEQRNPLKKTSTHKFLINVLWVSAICCGFLLIYMYVNTPINMKIQATFVFSQPSEMKLESVEIKSQVNAETIPKLEIQNNVKNVNLELKPENNVNNVNLKLKPEEALSPVMQSVLALLNYKRNGVFLEYRAGDGIRGSLTRYLEESKGWTGMLVEPRSQLYANLITNNRRSSTVQACLGVSDKSKMREDWTPCLALENILFIMKYPRVDYLALSSAEDVYQILQDSDLKKLQIPVVSVQCCPSNNPADKISDLMKISGFSQISSIGEFNVESTELCRQLVFKVAN